MRKMIEIKELHYIAHLENIPSILGKGILCHNKIKKTTFKDISLTEVQERRLKKRIPGGGSLHNYVNMYFDAHNPMLSCLRAFNNDICILRINSNVLNLPGCIITDRNASSDYVKFFTVKDGLDKLEFDKIFDNYWHHVGYDEYDQMEHKSIKCAEVLIPLILSSNYIIGAYVMNEDVKEKLVKVGFNQPITIKNEMFF